MEKAPFTRLLAEDIGSKQQALSHLLITEHHAMVRSQRHHPRLATAQIRRNATTLEDGLPAPQHLLPTMKRCPARMCTGNRRLLCPEFLHGSKIAGLEGLV